MTSTIAIGATIRTESISAATRRCSPTRPANNLAALERQGKATRVKVGRSVLWSWAGELVDLGDIEDFPTPSAETLAKMEVSERIAALKANEVEVEWSADPLRSKDGREWAGGVRLRRNGPLRTFRIYLWEGATSLQLVAALTDATSLMTAKKGTLPKKGACCVGSLEDHS